MNTQLETIFGDARANPADIVSATQHASAPEPMARFCPGCGSVGEVPDKFRDCCPDGGRARVIPAALAGHCHDLFKAALNAAAAPPARPGSYVNGASIKASDTPVQVVRKLDAAWASATDHKWEPLPSPTFGFNLGERIAHVGGRTNAAGYIEFGSPMAVQALIQHVIRDTRAPTAKSGDAPGAPA